MAKEYFPNIGKIPFEGPDSKNPMAFHYYDANKVILGKPMKDWLRFAMAWWHTLCADGTDQFGPGTKTFPWNDAPDALTAAKQKADAGNGNIVRFDKIVFPMTGRHSMAQLRGVSGKIVKRRHAAGQEPQFVRGQPFMAAHLPGKKFVRQREAHQ